MASKRAPKKKQLEEHTHLVLRVERYDVDLDACINRDAEHPEYAWNLDEDAPLLEFTTRLAITATSIQPDKRANEPYEVTLYGEEVPRGRLAATLRDVQERDERWAPKYRQYRGKQIPVYRAPDGMGVLGKNRGRGVWEATLFVPGRFAGVWLSLLGQKGTLFLTIHERKVGRDRFIQSISLQTNEPSDE